MHMSQQDPEVIEQIRAAEERIRPYVRETPLEHSNPLSAMGGGEVLLKMENLQLTGSFKLRGALSKLLSLSSSERARGIVAASSGNHGLGVARGCAELGIPGVIYVPRDASPSKLDLIRGYGARVQVHGSDCVESEAEARRVAGETGATYISPYNDIAVLAGQGTIAVEITRQAEHADAVFVSVGGGGLISGIGSWIKHRWPDAEIVACSPAASCVMHNSLQEGRMLDLPSEPTLSDGTAGGVEQDTITFPICQEIVSRSVLVSEERIASAMRLVIESHHVLVEGSAGVAVAAWLQERERHAGKRVVILLCGANIGSKVLAQVLAGEPS
jgi:threonine dehydratase